MILNFRIEIIKTIVVILMLVFSSSQVLSQDLNPVTWTVSYNDSLLKNRVRLEFKAKIEDGWHLYALELDSDEGPLPTEMLFDKIENAELLDTKQTYTPIVEYDPNFDMELRYFKKSVTIIQDVVVLDMSESTLISGVISFMVCDDERCLPPRDEPFTVTIDNKELE